MVVHAIHMHDPAGLRVTAWISVIFGGILLLSGLLSFVGSDHLQIDDDIYVDALTRCYGIFCGIISIWFFVLARRAWRSRSSHAARKTKQMAIFICVASILSFPIGLIFWLFAVHYAKKAENRFAAETTAQTADPAAVTAVAMPYGVNAHQVPPYGHPMNTSQPATTQMPYGRPGNAKI